MKRTRNREKKISKKEIKKLIKIEKDMKAQKDSIKAQRRYAEWQSREADRAKNKFVCMVLKLKVRFYPKERYDPQSSLI